MSDSGSRGFRPILAEDQVRLGAVRALRLALSGMSYRMFRSSVTMAILALATAFLVHMLSYGLLQQGTERSAFAELSRHRQVGQMMTRLADVDQDAAIIDGLSSAKSERLSEYRRWAAVGESEIQQAVAIARQLRTAARSLNDLPVAARAVMLGDRKPEEFLLNFNPDSLAEFDAQARQLGVRPPFGTAAAFRAFVVESVPRLRDLVTAVRSGQRRAIEQLAAAFGGKTVADALQQPTPDLLSRLRALGYELSDADLSDLSHLQRRTNDIATLNQRLQNGEVATEIGRLAAIDASRLNFETLCSFVTSASRARAAHRVLAKAGSLNAITEGRLLQLSSERNRELQLARALGAQSEMLSAGRFGLSERNQWLVVLSFLVCIIGVANAMLMSVTERFTEIATMKCLGAMDGFVMMMFVFEAMIQGVAGGIVGLFVGVVLAVTRAGIEYGSLLLNATGTVGPVLLAMAFSLLVSIVLAAAAAVGPSWLAARLSPMEAMRVE